MDDGKTHNGTSCVYTRIQSFLETFNTRKKGKIAIWEAFPFLKPFLTCPLMRGYSKAYRTNRSVVVFPAAAGDLFVNWPAAAAARSDWKKKKKKKERCDIIIVGLSSRRLWSYFYCIIVNCIVNVCVCVWKCTRQ